MTLASQPPDDVDATLDAADAVIALVRSVEIGGGRGDTAGVVMHGAYLRGFRRLVSIRELAGRGAGEDAYVLLRALLSLVARALWVNQPSDSDERKARFLRFRRRDLEDGLRMIDEGATIDLAPDDPNVRLALIKELARLKADGAFVSYRP